MAQAGELSGFMTNPQYSIRALEETGHQSVLQAGGVAGVINDRAYPIEPDKPVIGPEPEVPVIGLEDGGDRFLLSSALLHLPNLESLSAGRTRCQCQQRHKHQHQLWQG